MISKERVFSSIVLIALTMWGIFNQWMFLAIIMALTVGGLYEFFHLIRKKGYPNYSYTGIVIGSLIPLAIFFRFEMGGKTELLFMVVLLLLIFLMQLMRKENVNAVVGISTTFFGILYVSWLFSFLIKIRFFMPEVPGAGVGLLAFILLVTKIGDIGALIIGSKYGKTPLLPRVSPNKTVEGCIGSFVFSVVGAVLGANLIPVELNLSLVHIGFIGAFFGGLGQLGDLSESLIKRDFNVKDSGKMLPALGGALDSIDSILFSAPVFYFYISLLYPFS